MTRFSAARTTATGPSRLSESSFGTAGSPDDRSERSKNPYVDRTPVPTTVHDLQEAARKLVSVMTTSPALSEQLSKGEGNVVPLALQGITSFAQSVVAAVDATNRLPGSGSAHEGELGKVLLALSLQAWKRTPPTAEEALFLEMLKRVKGEGLRPEPPDWFAPVQGLLTATSKGKGHLGKEIYINASAAVASERTALADSRADVQVRHKDLEDKNLAATSKGKAAPFATGAATLKGQLDEFDRRFVALYEKVNDVDPTQIPPAMSALGVAVAPAPALIDQLLRAAKSIEDTIGAAALHTRGRPGGNAVLRVPTFKSPRELAVVPVELDSAALQGLWSSERDLTALLSSWMEVRQALARLFPTLPHSLVKAADHETVRAPLLEPFFRVGADASLVQQALMNHPAHSVRAATATLFRLPVLSTAKEESWTQLVARPKFAGQIMWAVQQLLSATNDIERRPFEKLLCSTPEVESAVMGPLRVAEEKFRRGDYQDLSVFLNERLESISEGSSQFLELLTTLSLLNFFSRFPESRDRLRHQLAAIDEAKGLPRALAATEPSLVAQFDEATRTVVKAFGTTLDDFVNLEDAKDLLECIEKFRYLMKHPERLEGVAGNVGIKSGLLLCGDPGVGKTHLVDCIAGELGIEKISISPDEMKPGGESMISVARKQIERAKAKSTKKEFCILFIDEGEAYVSERDSPNISAEKEEMVDYLLQQINEMRKDHPRILVIVATNFVHKIDEAALRKGRLDYIVYMEPPNDKQREAIILSTLSNPKFKIPFRPDAAQLRKLVEISQGFIPLEITNAIVEEHLIVVPMRRDRGEDVEYGFDVLLARFEAEQKRCKANEQRRREKKVRFSRGDDDARGAQPTN